MARLRSLNLPHEVKRAWLILWVRKSSRFLPEEVDSWRGPVLVLVSVSFPPYQSVLRTQTSHFDEMVGSVFMASLKDSWPERFLNQCVTAIQRTGTPLGDISYGLVGGCRGGNAHLALPGFWSSSFPFLRIAISMTAILMKSLFSLMSLCRATGPAATSAKASSEVGCVRRLITLGEEPLLDRDTL